MDINNLGKLSGADEEPQRPVNTIESPKLAPSVLDVEMERRIMRSIADSPDRDILIEQWGAAETLKNFFPGASRAQVFENFPAYAEEYFGKGQVPTKNGWNVFKDSVRIGDLSLANGAMSFQLLVGELTGQDTDNMGWFSWENALQGKQSLANIKERIKTNNAEIARLSFDAAPQSWGRTWLKNVGQTLPSVVNGTLQALTAAMAGSAVQTLASGATAAAAASLESRIVAEAATEAAKTAGSAANTTLSAQIGQYAGNMITRGQFIKTGILEKMAVQGVTWAQGMQTLAGLDYQEMLERGFDPKIAARTSLVTGSLNQVIEQALGFEVGMQKLFSATGATQRLVDVIGARIHASGILQPLAALAVNALGETAEEASQSLTTGLGMIIAQSIQEETEGLGEVSDPITVAQIADSVGKSIVDTIVTAPILGLPTSIVSTMRDRKAAAELSRQAPSMTKEAFRRVAVDKGIFEGMSDQAQREAADTMYERSMAQYKAAEEAAYKGAKQQVKEGQAEPTRMESGALNVRPDVVRTEGTEEFVNYHILSAKEEDSADLEDYGVIETRFDSATNTITVESSDFKPERMGLIDEAMQEVIAQHPDAKIELGSFVDPQTEGAYERLTSANPNGPEAGPSWYNKKDSRIDAIAKIRMRNELSRTSARNLSLGQREAIIFEMQQFANAAGKGFSDFWKGLSGISYGKSEALSAAGKAGAFEMFDLDGTRIEAKDAIKMAKSMIYLAENASYATISHELAHHGLVALKISAPDQLAAIEKSYGIADGVWTDDNMERFVKEFENYKANKTTADPRLKPIFERIAKWLKETWKGALEKLNIQPEVRDKFEEWFGASQVDSVDERPMLDEQGEAIEGEQAETAIEITREPRSDAERRLVGPANEIMLKDLGAIAQAGADLASKSLLEERVRRWQSGEWLDDPQLVREAREAAGIQASESDMEVDALAAMDAEELKVDPLGQGLLFMSKEESDAKKYDAEYAMSLDAKDYSTLEDWIKAIGGVYEAMSEEEKKYWVARYEYLRSGKKARFPKRGDFTKYIAVRKNLSDFLYAINRAVNPTKSQSEAERVRTRRIRDLISQSPKIVGAVDQLIGKGMMPNQKQSDALLAYIRSNEPLIKMLYAEVADDIDLAQEALTDMKRIPELKKRTFVSRPGRTIAEQAAILKQLGEDEIVERVLNKQATINDVQHFIKKAVAETKNKDKEKYKQFFKEHYQKRMAAKKMTQYMHKLHDFIMQPPSARMDNRSAKLILFIQEYLQNGGKLDIESMRSLSSVVFQEQPELVASMISLLSAIGPKDFKDWTIEQLEQLADIMDILRKAGRAEYRKWELGWGESAKAQRFMLLSAIQKSKWYVDPPDRASSERWHELQESARRRFFGVSAMRPDAFFNRIDGSGVLTEFFVNGAARAYSDKYKNFDERTDAIIRFIDEKNISRGNKDNKHGIFRKLVIEGAGANGGNVELTAVELLGLKLLVGEREEGKYDRKQREAAIYGNLFSMEEKDQDGMLYQSGESEHPANDVMRAQYEGKLKKVLDAYSMLTADEIALGNMMIEAMDSKEHWLRFSNAILNITGREMKKERWYFPIRRTVPLVVNDDEIADDIVKSGTFPAFLEMGITLNRSNEIQPRNQHPVMLDAFKVFFETVEKQEQLICVGEWAKRAKMLFQNSTFSGGITEGVRVIAGDAGVKYVNDFIESVTNPAAMKKSRAGDELISTFRGKIYVGSLAYRLSTIAMQLATSPLPFIADAPLETLAVAAEAYTSGNLVQWYKNIEAQSPELRHRQMDPLLAEYLNLRETKERTLLAAIGQKGMDPLVFADKISVAIGWEAVRRHKLGEYAEEIASGRKSQEVAEAMARDYANQIVRQTQPTSEGMFRAPMYRDMNSALQILLQFTQPLNVIWNNIRYDVPNEWKNHSKSRAVGLIAAYAMSGMAIGLIKAARLGVKGKEPGKEDDEQKWLKFWILASSSQFTESVPLIGGMLGQAVSSAVMGTPAIFNEQRLPATDALAKAISRLGVALQKQEGLTSNDVEAILRLGFEGSGLLVGAPTLAATGAYDFVKRILDRE